MATRYPPLVTVSAPVPTGPEAMPLPVVGVLLDPMRRPPLLMASPPPNVLCPESCSTPAPVLVTVAPLPMMFAAMLIDGVRLLNGVARSRPGAPTLKVLKAEPKSSVPLIVGVVARLLDVTAMGVDEDRASVPAVVTNGLVRPPLLLKFKAKSVLSPASVSVELPLRVIVLVAPIWPCTVPMIKVPEFRVIPPDGITTVELTPLSISVPWFTTVPLV